MPRYRRKLHHCRGSHFSAGSWLAANNYKVIGDSQSNCFMIDTERNGRSVITAMQAKNVFIGRTWPIWPNAVRMSVGTPAEMAKFKTAFKEVMTCLPRQWRGARSDA